MKYSMEIMHKPLINSDNNEKLGRINGFIISPDERRVVAFILEPRPKENTFMVVPFASVKSIYNDAVIVENLSEPLKLNQTPKLMELFIQDVAIVGSQVITDTGMLAGEAVDFAFAIETGQLQRLRMDQKPGFPESFDMSLALKLTKERIIVSHQIQDPAALAEAIQVRKAELRKKAEPEEEAPAPAPEPAPPAAPEPERETVADEQQQPQEPEASPTPRVDTVRMQLLVQELRKDLHTEIQELYSTMFKDDLREGLQEVSRILMERINTLDPAKRLEEFREQLHEELKTTLRPEKSRDTEDTPFELILEEKLKQFAAARMDEAVQRTEALEQRLESLQQSQAQLVETLSGLEQNLPAHISELLKSGQEEKPDTTGQIQEQIQTRLGEIKQALEQKIDDASSSAVTHDHLNSLFDRQREQLQDRANALRKSFIEDVGTLGANIFEERLRAMTESVSRELDKFRSELTVNIPDNLNAELKSAEEARLSFDDLKTDLNEAFNQAANHIESGVTGAINKLQENLENRSGGDEQVSSLLEQIREAVSGPGVDTGEITQSVRDAVSQSIENISQKISQDIAQQKQEQDDKLNAMCALLEKAAGLELTEEQASGLNQAAEEARALRQRLDQALGDMETRISDIAGNIEARLSEQSEPLRQANEALQALAAESGDELMSRLDEILQGVEMQSVSMTRGMSAAMDERIEAVRDHIAEQLEPLHSALQAAGGKPAQDVQKLNERLDQLLSTVEEKLAHLSSAVEAAGGKPAQDVQKLNERLDQILSTVEEKLEPLQQKLEQSQDPPDLGEFLDSAVERMDEALARFRHDFTGGVEGRGGLFMQQLDRIDSAVENRIEKVVEKQQYHQDLVEKIHKDLDTRFQGVRATIEETLQSEFARHTETTVEKTGGFEEALNKIRKSIDALGTLPTGDDLEGVKKEFLDELRAYSESNIKSEDLAEIKEWLEKAVDNLVRAMAREGEEKMGRALTAIKNFQKEIAVDIGQFRSDLETQRQYVLEGVATRLESLGDGLRGNLGLDELEGKLMEAAKPDADKLVTAVDDALGRLEELLSRAHGRGEASDALLAKVSQASQQAADTTRSAADEFRGAVNVIIEAIEQVGAQSPSAKVDLTETARLLDERIQDMSATLESKLVQKTGETVQALEKQLAARDNNLQDNLERLARAVDKLLSRGGGGGGGLGEMLSGRLMSFFGGGGGAETEQQRTDSRMRIQDTQAKPQPQKKRPAPTGPADAAQVRRLAYLIGKTVTRNIEDKQGNLIAAQGDIVDDETIRVARDAHRVLDLIRAVDLSQD